MNRNSNLKKNRCNSKAYNLSQYLIFKPLSYCFEETIGFEVKASFASRPVSRLIRWYNKPGDIIKEFWEETIQFHGTFHGLKIQTDQGFSTTISESIFDICQ